MSLHPECIERHNRHMLTCVYKKSIYSSPYLLCLFVCSEWSVSTHLRNMKRHVVWPPTNIRNWVANDQEEFIYFQCKSFFGLKTNRNPFVISCCPALLDTFSSIANKSEHKLALFVDNFNSSRDDLCSNNEFLLLLWCLLFFIFPTHDSRRN